MPKGRSRRPMLVAWIGRPVCQSDQGCSSNRSECAGLVESGGELAHRPTLAAGSFKVPHNQASARMANGVQANVDTLLGCRPST